jgi:lipoprotein-releasing system permease protein
MRAGRATPFVSFIIAVAVIGVMLGTAALNVAMSVIQGFEARLAENIVAFTGEIEVQGFQRQPLRDYTSATARIAAIPGIRTAAPFIAREVIVRGKGGIEGVFLKGIDPANDITGIAAHVIAGSWSFTRNGKSAAVIGKRLAEKLGVGVGDSILLIPINGVPSPDEPVRLSRVGIAGLYETGFSEYDDLYAYVALPDAQRLMQLPPDVVSGFDVRTRGGMSLDTLAIEIEREMGYPFYARTMYEMYPGIFAWIELQKKPVPIVLGLIVIVAAFNVIATLLMIVLEKTHAVGILKTLGARQRDIRAIFLRQGAIVAIAGVVLGDGLGYLICWLQQTYHIVTLKSDVYFMSVAPIEMQWSSFAIVSVLAGALCILAAAIPARIASRLTPVKALRFG